VKRTIVIGGTGFIGRHVCRLLLQQNCEVVVVGRKKSIQKSLPEGCRYLSGNYGDIEILRAILTPGCDVIDLAYSTVPKTSFEEPLYDLTSNLPSSVSLLREASSIGVRRILIISSGGTVYGPVKSLPITENHPTCPISPYGITKLAIDRYAMMFHLNEGLPVIIARPGNAYGSDQRLGTGQGFIAAAINAILAGKEIEIYGVKGTIRDYIHVSDVASGIVAALNSGSPGSIYNIGTEIGASNIDIVNILRKISEKDGFKVRTRILPARGFDVESNVLDSSRLKKDCGWTPKTKLKHGIQQMWDEFRTRYALTGAC
jgi:UDP-glucose 4-epimerase